MALERVGLGGVLTFDGNQAVRAAGQTRDAFGRFIRTVEPAPTLFGRIGQSVQAMSQRMRGAAQQIGRGITQLAGAAQQAGAAMLPMTAAVAVGTERAASFEHQMSAVSAITNGSAEDMSTLTAAARQAGIETAFSATQAGQAMEYMARSGATTTEIVGGLRGVVDAAAAEGLDLASASNIVAQTTRIMGREWSQASNTADILVRVSQRANTDVTQLGEAMRYGGQAAFGAGLDLEETAGIMGRLADAGLSGSTGGTALQNALNKLARPTSTATEYLQRFGIEMTRTAGGGVDLVNISQQIANAMEGIEDPLERTAIASEIFGLRGRRAYEALAQAGEESTDSLIAELRRASEGQGAAAEAAERRLDNFKGAFTLLMSSLEGVAIAIFGPMMEPMKEVIQNITNGLNAILQGVSAVMDAGDNAVARYEALNSLIENNGENTTSIVMGIVDAIGDLRNAFNTVRDAVMRLKEGFEDAVGPDAMRMITRVAVLMGIAAAAIGPLLLGLGSIILLVSTVGSGVIGGIGAILGAVFLPLIVAIGVLVGLFFAIRREGESTGETLARIWGVIRVAALRTYYGAILPFWNGFQEAAGPVLSELRLLWNELVRTFRATIGELSSQFSQFFGDSETDWEGMGATVARVLGFIGQIIMFTLTILTVGIGAIIGAIGRLVRQLVNNLSETFGFLISHIRNVYNAWSLIFSGNIMEGLRRLGQAMLDFVLEPIKMVIRGITTLLDAIGGENLISTRVRDWARAAAPVVRGRGAPQGEQSDLFSALFGEGAVPTAPGRAAEPAGVTRERDALAAEVGRTAARATRRRAAPGTVSAEVELSDERQIDVNNEVCVDGQQLAVASQRHRTEIGERSGFRTTPWRRRLRAEQGAVPEEG